jgi:hypothetical protein
VLALKVWRAIKTWLSTSRSSLTSVSVNAAEKAGTNSGDAPIFAPAKPKNVRMVIGPNGEAVNLAVWTAGGPYPVLGVFTGGGSDWVMAQPYQHIDATTSKG